MVIRKEGYNFKNLGKTATIEIVTKNVFLAIIPLY